MTLAYVSLFAILSACGGTAGSAPDPSPTDAPPRAQHPPDDAMPYEQAIAAPEETPVSFVAWVWGLPADCAPCPDDEDVACEACFPAYHQFGPSPQRSAGTSLIEVDSLSDLSTIAVGQRVALEGQWALDHGVESGRLFIAESVVLLP